MTLSRAEKLLLLTTVFGLLHHVDHVLRVDHSGWPFIAEVTPFTYSLAVYPVIVAVFIFRRWPRLRAGLAAALFAFPTLSHIFIETPVHQYRTWAAQPDVNALAVSSPLLGGAAVVITVALSGFAGWAMYAFFQGARSGAGVPPR
jgi:hypothetical protein